MDITEFEYLDPTRVDAVLSPANGIEFLMLKRLDDDEPMPLLAKAAEALDDVLRTEPRAATPKRKAPKKVNRKKLIKQLTETQAQLAAAGLSATPVRRAPMSLADAMRKMRRAADAAEAEGDVAKARGLRHDLTVAGLGAQLASPAATNRRLLGAGVPLFKNRHALPDDPEVKYAE